MKQNQTHTVQLDAIVGGGQTIGTLDDGRKAFVWGGLPGETVTVEETKRKSKYIEAIVIDVQNSSKERVDPRDPDSYLSTSPWQILDFEREQHYKAALILEAFNLHDVQLPSTVDVFTDGVEYEYRNKVEFSWFGEEIDGHDQLDLAFFRRGTRGKIPVESCALLPEPMMNLALTIRDTLRKRSVTARELKTLLIRSDQAGNCVWQLYVKTEDFDVFDDKAATELGAQGGEIIFSNPRSPASRITRRLSSYGTIVLTDTVLDVPFRYATEGFFQINIPVYERALRDMSEWVKGDSAGSKTVDLYSGVGSIGLTIGGDNCTLIEVDENAVREMKQNIADLSSKAEAILAPAERSLDYITSDATIIIDPPRVGLHADVIERILEAKPPRVVYLSCNPVTQARDVALLASGYKIVHHQGYNFFPRTPHIENLVVLDLI